MSFKKRVTPLARGKEDVLNCEHGVYFEDDCGPCYVDKLHEKDRRIREMENALIATEASLYFLKCICDSFKVKDLAWDKVFRIIDDVLPPKRKSNDK